MASEAQDRPLPWHERWALRSHLLICRSCRRFSRQLAALRALLARMPESAQQQAREALPTLSAERKLQIKQLLREIGPSESS